MKHLAILVSIFLLGPSALVNAENQKPNIIFIMADDLGWKDVGYAGAEFFETPHINQLANSGMAFSSAYSGGPNCAPTRGCLLTGTYTPRHHIYQPGGTSKGNPKYMKLLVPARERRDKDLKAKATAQFKITNSLDPKFICIPEVLKSAGYTSARLGKWHLGEDTQGFDLSSADGKDSKHGKFYGNIDVAEQLTDRALQFIEQNRKGPFFLYLSHWDVHVPHRARNEVVKKCQKKLDGIPIDKRQNFKPVYAAMLEAVDTSVGRVVALPASEPANERECGAGTNSTMSRPSCTHWIAWSPAYTASSSRIAFSTVIWPRSPTRLGIPTTTLSFVSPSYQYVSIDLFIQPSDPVRGHLTLVTLRRRVRDARARQFHIRPCGNAGSRL